MRLFYIIFISILRLSKCSNTCSDPDCIFSFPDCLDPIQVIFFYRIGFGKFPLIVYTGFSNDICIRTTCPVTGYFFFIITDRNLPKDQCISFFYRVARMYVGGSGSCYDFYNSAFLLQQDRCVPLAFCPVLSSHLRFP